MEGKSLSNRIKWVDIAKGIGILLILLSHSVWSESVQWADGLLIPIFFFLSGYNFSRPKILSKAKSLLMPYLFYNILIIAFAILAGSKHFDITALEGIAYSRYSLFPTDAQSNTILLGYGNAPLWFLTALFVSYLLFLPLTKMTTRAASLSCCFYILATAAFRFCPILLPWSFDCALFFAVIMYFGLTIRRHSVTHIWIPILCAAIYAIMMLVNGHINLSVREFGKSVILCLIISASGCIVISEIAKKISDYTISSPIAMVGKYSLSIFCLQLPVLHIVKSITSGLFPNHTIVIALLQVLAGCIFGIVFAIVIDRVKLLINVR